MSAQAKQRATNILENAVQEYGIPLDDRGRRVLDDAVNELVGEFDQFRQQAAGVAYHEGERLGAGRGDVQRVLRAALIEDGQQEAEPVLAEAPVAAAQQTDDGLLQRLAEFARGYGFQG